MAGAYPTELKHPKGAVGQNGTTGGTGAYPTENGRDKGAVGNVAAGGATPKNVFGLALVGPLGRVVL